MPTAPPSPGSRGCALGPEFSDPLIIRYPAFLGGEVLCCPLAVPKNEPLEQPTGVSHVEVILKLSQAGTLVQNLTALQRFSSAGPICPMSLKRSKTVRSQCLALTKTFDHLRLGPITL